MNDTLDTIHHFRTGCSLNANSYTKPLSFIICVACCKAETTLPFRSGSCQFTISNTSLDRGLVLERDSCPSWGECCFNQIAGYGSNDKKSFCDFPDCPVQHFVFCGRLCTAIFFIIQKLFPVFSQIFIKNLVLVTSLNITRYFWIFKQNLQLI